jgi:hexokinase
MSERKISVSLTFDFYPDGEHEDLFEEMTEGEILSSAKSMAYDDIINGDVWRMLSVELTKE